ncbi:MULTISPECIES: hypothetical protein [unclassified Bradyrhizobium]|uniref:hypothetical protein n=1 Tax=unclassified Bradyrhizobium TaxID=2631580 RepID=UPI00247ACF1B|nr:MULTISPECIES: hypothetical protein [unclassified Bradyrhizobium]WGS20862.1 hypothetical protein MTX22_03420 [Bradyrhizobium sp. ISRA463]WGS27759.1 hypothetical protein MTX19_01275 [Bradyrhizobium sp. ISRA464]
MVHVVAKRRCRWPLVRGDDLILIALHALALRRPGRIELHRRRDRRLSGRAQRAFARGDGGPQDLAVVSSDTIATELGKWARGYGLDQGPSGTKARLDLGRQPKHLDPEPEIEAPAWK